MEDIERDTQRPLKDPAFTKPKKRSNHWTVLFVGDQGKIIRIRNFKFLLIVWVSVICITTGAAGLFFFLYQDVTEEMVSLKEDLNDSQKRTKALRDEKDILLARLVVIDSKIKTRRSKPAKQKIDKTAKLKSETDTPQVAAPEPTQPIETVDFQPPKENIETAMTEESTQEAMDQESDDKESIDIVAVDDFFVLIEEDSNTLRVKYKIRNVSQSSKPVSGRTFMILKENEEDRTTWMVFPETLMNSGKPTQIDKGRSFSITRFKTIRYKAPYQNGGKPFATATILVYSTAGELLVENSFPIEKGGENSVQTY